MNRPDESRLDELPIEGPPFSPPDTDPPPPSAPSYEDLGIDAEFTAVELAWDEILAAPNEDEARRNLSGAPLLWWLFAACSSGSYEGAEGDPPAIPILRAARETVEGWARSHSGSTIFADVSYTDLGLLARRLDAAIQIVKAQTSILLRRAEKAEQAGGAR
jgi:hypothetical protein